MPSVISKLCAGRKAYVARCAERQKSRRSRPTVTGRVQSLVRLSPFDHRGEESVARMHAGNCSQIESSEKRRDILPAHLARLLQLLQFPFEVGDLEFRRAIE